VIRSGFLPVPNSANEHDDPDLFRPAPNPIVFHEFILLPNGSEFEALRQWLIAQGFVIKQVQEPQPWRTYPEIKFSGTAAQINEAFPVTVMQRVFSYRQCYTIFTNLLMPAQFAPKGEDYIEGFSFGPDATPDLKSSCP
jgi:hypothetical protein